MQKLGREKKIFKEGLSQTCGFFITKVLKWYIVYCKIKYKILLH